MIKTLELRNFQGHKQSSFNFSPGVNVIRGTSHNGKTAVIRAIKWALTNRPAVNVVRNWFISKSDEVKVAMEFDDGYIIRKQNKDFNGYMLPDMTFDAIGRNVPDEVTRLARMSDINLQSQHDKYFMIQESAEAAAQKLNEVVGLQIIDEVISLTVKEVQSRKDAIKGSELSIQRTEQALQELAFVENLSELVDRIDRNLEHCESMKERRSKLLELKDHIVNLQHDNRSLKQFLTAETHCERLIETGEELRKTSSRIYRLATIYEEIGQHRNALETMSDILRIEDPVDSLTGLQKEIREIQNKRIPLERLYESIRDLRNEQIEHSSEIRALQTDYDSTVKEQKICPLCGKERICPNCGYVSAP